MNRNGFAGVIRRGYWAWGIGIVLGASIAGCGNGRGAAAARPADGLSPPPAARAKPTDIRKYRHSVLLDFDRPTDAVFVTAVGDAQSILPLTAQSSQLILPDSTQRAEIKLSSLLTGRAFPADWTLLGCHIRSDRDAAVDLVYSVDGEPVLRKRQMLSRGRSQPVLLDLSTLSQSHALGADQVALLSIIPQSPAGLQIDDVLLIDNRENLSPAGSDWTIEQTGHSLAIDRPQRFRILLPIDLTQKPAWEVAEAGACA